MDPALVETEVVGVEVILLVGEMWDPQDDPSLTKANTCVQLRPRANDPILTHWYSTFSILITCSAS